MSDVRHIGLGPVIQECPYVGLPILLLSQTGLVSRCAWALGLIDDPGQFPQLLFTPGCGGTILAYLWKEVPFVAYFTLALMSGVSATLGEAAENLGASPLRSFLTVTLPLSLPAVSQAFLIIFLFAFGGYELPLLLGATVPKSLPVYAHLAYMHPDLRQRPAALRQQRSQRLQQQRSRC